MQTILGKHWHHLPGTEALGLLETDRDRGMDSFDVRLVGARSAASHARVWTCTKSVIEEIPLSISNVFLESFGGTTVDGHVY